MGNYFLNVYDYGDTLPIEALSERLCAATGGPIVAERVEMSSGRVSYRFILSRELLRAERGHAIAISCGYLADIETIREG